MEWDDKKLLWDPKHYEYRRQAGTWKSQDYTLHVVTLVKPAKLSHSRPLRPLGLPAGTNLAVSKGAWIPYP